MKRKYLVVLTVLLALCLAFTGYGVYVSGEHPVPVATTVSTASTESESTAGVTTTTAVSTEKESTTAGETTTAPTEKQTTKAHTTAATTKTDGGAKKTTSSSSSKSTKKKKPASTTAITNSTTATTESTTVDTTTCVVTIQCKDILQHRDKLSEKAAPYVPSNGYLLYRCAVPWEQGDTAFTVFQRACNANGIHYLAKQTMYGKYIAEINHIAEKCCGSGSGWLYEVNGKLPSVSTSSYSVKGGDVLEFRFTCGY